MRRCRRDALLPEVCSLTAGPTPGHSPPRADLPGFYPAVYPALYGAWTASLGPALKRSAGTLEAHSAREGCNLRADTTIFRAGKTSQGKHRFSSPMLATAGVGSVHRL